MIIVTAMVLIATGDRMLAMQMLAHHHGDDHRVMPPLIGMAGPHISVRRACVIMLMIICGSGRHSGGMGGATITYAVIGGMIGGDGGGGLATAGYREVPPVIARVSLDSSAGGRAGRPKFLRYLIA